MRRIETPGGEAVPAAKKLKNENDGECHDCGDPAQIGPYQCVACHAQAREEAGFNG